MLKFFSQASGFDPGPQNQKSNMLPLCHKVLWWLWTNFIDIDQIYSIYQDLVFIQDHSLGKLIICDYHSSSFLIQIAQRTGCFVGKMAMDEQEVLSRGAIKKRFPNEVWDGMCGWGRSGGSYFDQFCPESCLTGIVVAKGLITWFYRTIKLYFLTHCLYFMQREQTWSWNSIMLWTCIYTMYNTYGF